MRRGAFHDSLAAQFHVWLALDRQRRRAVLRMLAVRLVTYGLLIPISVKRDTTGLGVPQLVRQRSTCELTMSDVEANT